MTKHNQRIGNLGEQLAADYLTTRGFLILARKQRTASGEIDIIAEKDGQTRFVEVKTRTNTKMGYPEGAITPIRYQRMQTCAQEFTADHNITTYQLDLISILLPAKGSAEVLFFENI